MNFVKIKDRYINVEEILCFEHLTDSEGDEILCINFKNKTGLNILGPKTLLGQFAKSIEEKTQYQPPKTFP